MSGSKFNLGGSPLLSSSSPKSGLDDLLSSSKTTGSTSPLGSNPLAPTSESNPLSFNPLAPSPSSSASIQVGDLLPTQPASSPLTLTENVQSHPAEAAQDLPAHPASKAIAAEAALSALGATSGQIVHLVASGPRKVAVIKMVRQHWNLGLKEAKHLVDAVPVDLPKLSPAETTSAQEALASLDAVMIMK